MIAADQGRVPVALVVDVVGYGARDDWMPMVAEWVGFTFLVALILLLPDAPRRKAPGATHPG